MADFLDQKEEVLRVELTKQGKIDLSNGVFQPSFFSFFDDTVIYDNSYTDYELEIQNNIQDRIIDKSITLTSVNNLYLSKEKKSLIKENLEEPLGNSNIFNDYSPAWNLSVLNGGITYNEASSSYGKKCFSFNDINFYTFLQNTNLSQTEIQNNSIFELENGQIIQVEDDYILIELSEENVSDDSKNFEIELYTFDELSGGKNGGLARKLDFFVRTNNIINDIIYDLEELPNINENTAITNNDASYYFDVLVDNEIDRNIIFKTEQTVKEQIDSVYKTNYDSKTPPKEDC
jgi:hypothetical protein